MARFILNLNTHECKTLASPSSRVCLVDVCVWVCVRPLFCVSIASQESSSSNTVAFMHQMIPHHENAVNMARVLLKNPGDEELDEEVRIR